MTKSELIEIITAKQKHLPAKDVELALKQILEIISMSSDFVMLDQRLSPDPMCSFSRSPRLVPEVAVSER